MKLFTPAKDEKIPFFHTKEQKFSYLTKIIKQSEKAKIEIISDAEPEIKNNCKCRIQ